MNKKEIQCSYNLMKFFGELVAGADHEINNLLLMVQGSAHILLSENPSIEARSMAIDAITEKTQRIKDIMEELRGLLNDGSSDPLKDNYVKDLTDKAIALCKTRFKNHRIFFSVNIAESSAIECKQTQIVQALLAILNSAHDSLIQGKEKWIQVQVFDLDEEVVLEVTDSGKAFSPEDEQRAFDLSYTSSSGRLGVSLALAQNIINSHGGKIEVFNKELIPTVRVILPRVQPASPAAGVVKVLHQEVEIYEENVTVLQHKRAA
jgi:signal transduction histidine kinase